MESQYNIKVECLSFDCFILYLISVAIFTIFVQEKYEEAIASLAQMEKRAVMAETMLEATLQYQSGQVKAQPSPRYVHIKIFAS